MKKILIPIAFFTLIFSSCKISQLESYQDDIYASPSEEKKLAKLAAAEQAKKAAEEKQKQEEAALTQKAKDDANPYYQDPQFNSDDYYDYKYASSISRFHNPVIGTGYYDNFYTNSYMYNQNPNMWGSSIYSSKETTMSNIKVTATLLESAGWTETQVDRYYKLLARKQQHGLNSLSISDRRFYLSAVPACGQRTSFIRR
jgi:hypothetical protein